MLSLHSVADGTFAQFTVAVDNGYRLLLVGIVTWDEFQVFDCVKVFHFVCLSNLWGGFPPRWFSFCGRLKNYGNKPNSRKAVYHPLN
jgi:hypothetical protein